MNGPRIGGIEPAEPTLETPASSTEISAQERPTPPREDRKVGHRLNWLLIPVVGLALVVATGAGAYVHRLNGRVTVLQAQLAQTRAAAQTALDRVSALRIPRDLSTEVASLEVTANKLRAADEALRRSFDEQSQKIPALESRLSDAHSSLAARLTEIGQESKAFREKEEMRVTNIIAVLKNQDRLLRRLTETSETHPAPRSEE
ncbi:MAG: hypothetical protein ABS95_00130 [Verrucomicrobia bacterium SCN 57-15]|nr:MAG: hypothetical protein ABS95_00130 [Verrucomicrobia bacterium SCN 57-15]